MKIKSTAQRLETLAYIVKHSLNVKQSEDHIEKLITPDNIAEKDTVFDYRSLISVIKKAIDSSRKYGTVVKTSHTETDNEIIYTVSVLKTPEDVTE